MTTNFTFRDFFVYLITGLTLITTLSIIFYQQIFIFTVHFFEKYEFIKEFNFMYTIFLVPIIYLLGHIIGSISYISLQMYCIINKKAEKYNYSVVKWLLKKLERILYRQRVGYAVKKYVETNQSSKSFNNIEELWVCCAKLQVQKNYTPAEYWYVLNELFNSINLIFFISAIVSIFTGHYVLFFTYIFLTVFAFNRAKQYAEHFVSTVSRIMSVTKV